MRGDFPLLRREIDGQPLVYLDSAATALKPDAVLARERLYSTEFTANIHRGKHTLSEEASEAYEQARRVVASFLGAAPESIVFTSNTTAGLNLLAHGLALGPEDVVLASCAEHHSNLAPWMARAKVAIMDSDGLVPTRPERLEAELLRVRPKVLTLGHASNVTGLVQPARELFEVARRHGVITVLDAAQSAPHLPLNVEALGCDFLAFSGHKLLGPTGVGVLYGRPERLEGLRPLVFGGGAVHRVTRDGFTLKRLPYRLEAGTPPVSAAIGLAAAITYLTALTWERVEAHERALAQALEEALTDLPGVRVLQARGAHRLAIASVAPLTDCPSPDQLALLLSDTHKVMVRSGFHCAHPLFDHLGLAFGAVRASAYLYNSVEEVRRFGDALRRLLLRMVGGA